MKAVITLGRITEEIELRTSPQQLSERLRIDLLTATKLAAMEVLSDARGGRNRTTFKNWKDKRIYFTNSVDSNSSNSKQRYWDLEAGRLIDQGQSLTDFENMVKALSKIALDTFK